MAYAKRLYLTFLDSQDSTAWLVEIYDDNYVGAATEMLMGGDPLEFRWIGSKWKNIVGCECDITLVSSASLSWLNVVDGRQIKVLIYRAGVLFYSGFALPDEFFESLNAFPRKYTFTVSDQIGLLDSVEYVDGSGDPYEDYDNGISIASKVLLKTGLALNINSACNLFEDNMATGATDDPIYQSLFRQDCIVDEELNPGSCYAMIDRILKTFQLRLFQSDGEWWLWRITEQTAYPFQYRKYDSAGSFVSLHSSGTPQQTTNGSTFALLSGGTVTAIPPFKSVTIFQDYGKRPSIFRGWKLPPLEFTDTTTCKHWYIIPASGWIQKIAGNEYMLECGGIGSFDELKNMRTELVAVTATTEKLTLTIKMGKIGAVTPRISVILDPTSGTDYYYQSIGWTQQATPLFLGNLMPVPQTTYDKTKEVQCEINGIPADGNIYVRFFAPSGGVGVTFFVSECKLQISPSDVTQYPASKTTTTVINEDNPVILKQYNQGFSDSPETDNPFAVYRNIVKFGTSITDGWQLQGIGTTRTLREWLEQWSDADTSPMKFSGMIRGDSFFRRSIILSEYGSREFVWEDVSYNPKSAIWNGSAIELKGVFLDGETTEENNIRGIGANLSVDQIDPSGDDGGTEVPPMFDYRAGSDTVSAGGDTVAFVDYFVDATDYILGIISVLDSGGNKVDWRITANDASGFTITTMRDATVKYFAFKTK